MDKSQSRTEKYGRIEAMKDLVERGYATSRQMLGDGAEFTVYIQGHQNAGGELLSILKRHGYFPTYPRPYDGDNFVFSVKCEPASWHEEAIDNCPKRDDE